MSFIICLKGIYTPSFLVRISQFLEGHRRSLACPCFIFFLQREYFIVPPIFFTVRVSGARRFRRAIEINRKDGWPESSGGISRRKKENYERGSSVISRLREFESWRDAISRGKTTDDDDEEEPFGRFGRRDHFLVLSPEIISTTLAVGSQSGGRKVAFTLFDFGIHCVRRPGVQPGWPGRGISRNSTPTSCIFMHRSNRCNCPRRTRFVARA